MSTHSSPELSPQEQLYRIVEEGMCVGCGICESLAGKDIVEIRTSKLNYQRPHVVGYLTQAVVDQIYDVCPGLHQDSLPQKFIDDDTVIDPHWGPLKSVSSAHAADDAVRIPAATGGVLTALASFLVDSGRVSYVLHAKPSDEDATFGQGHVSLTAEDVNQGMGSIYGPVAPLRNLQTLLDKGKPFAVVARPCDISALNNYARYEPRIYELIKYKLTPTCGGSIPPPQMDIFLKSKNTRREDLVRFNYRADGCPGEVEYETKDGETGTANSWEPYGYDPDAAPEESWKIPFRCKICPDGPGEGADIMAGDQWVDCAPDPEFSKIDKGTNAVIVRTSAGAELFEAAVYAGYLTVESERDPRWFDVMQPHLVQKKMYVRARWDGLAAAGRLMPKSDGLRLEHFAAQNTQDVNNAQTEGTKRRVLSGKEDEPTPQV